MSLTVRPFNMPNYFGPIQAINSARNPLGLSPGGADFKAIFVEMNLFHQKESRLTERINTTSACSSNANLLTSFELLCIMPSPLTQPLCADCVVLNANCDCIWQNNWYPNQ